MFELIIADLDGTLVSLEGGRYVLTYSEIYRNVLSELTGKDFSRYNEWDLYAPISLPYKESVDMLKSWGINDPNTLWSEIAKRDYAARRQRMGKSIVLYPDVIKFLRHVQKSNGRKVCIVSNTPEPIALMEMNELGLTKYIDERDVFCFQYKEPRSKPEPWAIKEIQKRYGVSPELTLVIGDSDMETNAGRAAGAKTAQLFRRGEHEYHHHGTNPDITCESLIKLLEVI